MAGYLLTSTPSHSSASSTLHPLVWNSMNLSLRLCTKVFGGKVLRILRATRILAGRLCVPKYTALVLCVLCAIDYSNSVISQRTIIYHHQREEKDAPKVKKLEKWERSLLHHQLVSSSCVIPSYPFYTQEQQRENHQHHRHSLSRATQTQLPPPQLSFGQSFSLLFSKRQNSRPKILDCQKDTKH